MTGNALLVLLSLLSGLRFWVDHAAFRSEHPDSVLVEFYHSIPYEELRYQSFQETLYAEYQLKVELEELATGYRVTESIYEPALIPPKSEPAARRLLIGNAFSVTMRPGRYYLRMEVSNAGNNGSWIETLAVRDIRQDPNLSDLVIGSSLLQTADGRTVVIPMANRRFGPPDRTGLHEMYVYVAGYGFRQRLVPAETLKHQLLVTVQDSAGQRVKSLPAEWRIRTGPEFSEIFGLSTQGLNPGRYVLRVMVRDEADSVPLVATKEFFVADRQETKPQFDTLLMTAEERAAYTDIRYLATDRELKQYNTLSRAGKFEWLRTQFWQQHDFARYLARLRIVDERFRQGRRPGRETDPGRVYLRYGEPDEIESHTMIEHARPHEHWRYYQLGYHFIFVDLGGDGRLRLIYSNTEREPCAPNWEKLVDPLELEGLQNR